MMTTLTVEYKNGATIRFETPFPLKSEEVRDRRKVGNVVGMRDRYLRISWDDPLSKDRKLWVFPLREIKRWEITE